MEIPIQTQKVFLHCLKQGIKKYSSESDNHQDKKDVLKSMKAFEILFQSSINSGQEEFKCNKIHLLELKFIILALIDKLKKEEHLNPIKTKYKNELYHLLDRIHLDEAKL